jgi:hypothetical protein
MSLGNLSLHQLNELSSISPMIGNFARRILAETYEDFIQCLYDDLENILCNIEKNPEYRQEDKEDRLTVDIVNGLHNLGYDASHDEKQGGHTDILVKKHNFIWIAEAKKVTSANSTYLFKGFQQLVTRYSNGNSNQNEGSLLVYIFCSNAKNVMEMWEEYLSKSEHYKENIRIEKGIDKNRQITFRSINKHPSSGLDYIVRHIPVLLYFNPKDKK